MLVVFHVTILSGWNKEIYFSLAYGYHYLSFIYLILIVYFVNYISINLILGVIKS